MLLTEEMRKKTQVVSFTVESFPNIDLLFRFAWMVLSYFIHLSLKVKIDSCYKLYEGYFIAECIFVIFKEVEENL